jgi:hypothetical protein
MANAMKQTLSRVQTIVEREKQQRDGNFLFKKHKVLLYLKSILLLRCIIFALYVWVNYKYIWGKKFNFLTSNNSFILHSALFIVVFSSPRKRIGHSLHKV